MNTRCPIIVMAKAPRPGEAKTRLIPALGADGAAMLAERMLRHTVTQACAAELGPVDLCCTPDSRHVAFEACAQAPAVELSVQAEGNLGTRMAAAFARWFDRASDPAKSVLMIGTDAPALEAGVLRLAAAALSRHDAVFVPALDGGYALIGLRRAQPLLFEGISWSTSHVMAQTRQRLAEIGWSHAELPSLADIDEPDDLAFVPAGWLS